MCTVCGDYLNCKLNSPAIRLPFEREPWWRRHPMTDTNRDTDRIASQIAKRLLDGGRRLAIVTTDRDEEKAGGIRGLSEKAIREVVKEVLDGDHR